MLFNLITLVFVSDELVAALVAQAEQYAPAPHQPMQQHPQQAMQQAALMQHPVVQQGGYVPQQGMQQGHVGVGGYMQQGQGRGFGMQQQQQQQQQPAMQQQQQPPAFAPDAWQGGASTTPA